MSHSSGIRDNRERGSVADFLREAIRPGANLSVVSAYFTIFAYDALKAHLDGIEHLRFLFGEPRFVETLDPSRSQAKAFAITDGGLTLANQLQQKQQALRCARWIKEKVEIRSVSRAGLLHGKLYHITNGPVAQAILGSSNFTQSGLGLKANGFNNLELNLVVDSDRDRRDLKAWFDELWNNTRVVSDVKEDVLRSLAQLYVHHAPQLVYYKTLYHLFREFLDAQGGSDLLGEAAQIVDTQIWQALFAFQKDGVKGAIGKILKHDGCIIADSVGLGKTYEALAVIKYFELRNQRVLVLCPKKLRENWTVYQASVASALNPFPADRFGYAVLSHTDLSRETGKAGDIDLATVNWGAFDLVVIDESHNFRNNVRGRRDADGQLISTSRYERLMEQIIKAGVKTKVLLLSATPVNNDLSDLRNQLMFITEGRDDALRESLGVNSLTATLAAAQREFAAWATEPGRSVGTLLDRLGTPLFTLLDELTIARSREHIRRYYRETIAELGGFPERLPPQSLHPSIDRRGRFMPYERLNDEIGRYKLALFNPTAYLRPEHRHRYDTERVRNFSQAQREHYLIGMMKVNFLKRLESSVHSFSRTLERTITKIEALIDQITAFQQQGTATTVELPELAADTESDDELRAVIEVGGRRVYQLAHLDLDAWLADLRKDVQQLHGIFLQANDITAERDAKLHALKELIAARAMSPTTDKQGRPNRKVLVFTAFADTAAYLYDALYAWAGHEHGLQAALVTGTGANRTTFGSPEFGAILTNFAPRAKRRAQIPSMQQTGELDLLIATDCISEGQNLQDCPYLVNYDIHWNPVRIIQRFGRIDRIGSQHAAVQLVNFWPTADLDAYINLRSRVEARMALVDVAATGHDNLLDVGQLEATVVDELGFRDAQLKRLQHEVLDLDDGEQITLSEFTLDDFRIDLANYIAANRQLLEITPLGINAVVPTHKDHPQIAPGVIFCLQQRDASEHTQSVNPLQPFYLVYVRDDGIVRFSFAQPKQILDIFRLLCAEHTTPYHKLCELWDQRTSDGADMTHASGLLAEAARSIAHTFKKRSAAVLTSGRGGIIAKESEQATDDAAFDLVTWLVISDER